MISPAKVTVPAEAPVVLMVRSRTLAIDSSLMAPPPVRNPRSIPVSAPETEPSNRIPPPWALPDPRVDKMVEAPRRVSPSSVIRLAAALLVAVLIDPVLRLIAPGVARRSAPLNRVSTSNWAK